MRTFGSIKEGEKFFVHGGFELQRVSESVEYNCVLVDDPSIGIRMEDNAEVFISLTDLPNDKVELLSI